MDCTINTGKVLKPVEKITAETESPENGEKTGIKRNLPRFFRPFDNALNVMYDFKYRSQVCLEHLMHLN